MGSYQMPPRRNALIPFYVFSIFFMSAPRFVISRFFYTGRASGPARQFRLPQYRFPHPRHTKLAKDVWPIDPAFPAAAAPGRPHMHYCPQQRGTMPVIWVKP